MELKEIEKNIIETIIEKAGLSVSASEFSPDTPLNKDEYALDSVQSLEVLVSLEQKFNITFHETDITNELFDTLGNLIQLVKKTIQESNFVEAVE